MNFTQPDAPTLPAAGAASVDSGSPPPTTDTSFTPDWNALISGDSGLLSAESALNASGAADKSALGAEIASAYESFGKPIDLSTLAGQLGMSQADIQGYLGSGVQKVAQENTDAGTSTVARLDAANTLANRNIVSGLNARGILNSGETGYQLDHQSTSYRQAQTDAYSKFLGYLQQYQQGYLAAQERRAEALAAAYSAAADRQFGLWGNRGGGGSSGGGSGGGYAPPPDWSQAAGGYQSPSTYAVPLPDTLVRGTGAQSSNLYGKI